MNLAGRVDPVRTGSADLGTVAVITAVITGACSADGGGAAVAIVFAARRCVLADLRDRTVRDEPPSPAHLESLRGVETTRAVGLTERHHNQVSDASWDVVRTARELEPGAGQER